MRWTWTVMRERVVKYAKEELGTKARNSGVEYRKSRVLSWCRDVYVCWHPIEWGSWRVERTHFGYFQVRNQTLAWVCTVSGILSSLSPQCLLQLSSLPDKTYFRFVYRARQEGFSRLRDSPLFPVGNHATQEKPILAGLVDMPQLPKIYETRLPLRGLTFYLVL